MREFENESERMRLPPVLSLFARCLLAPARHLGLLVGATGGANLDGRVLKWGGCHGYLIATLSKENINH